MFAAMVEPIASEFLDNCTGSMEETFENFSEEDFLEHFNEFRAQKNREFICYSYDNYDVFRLLLCCSKGTPYEDYQHRLIQIEQQNVLDLFHFMDQRGIPHNTVTPDELHIICATLVGSACEAVRHEYTREQALKHIDFLGTLLYPGMKNVLGF